jgi:lysyl-tRNA synthetase class 2
LRIATELHLKRLIVGGFDKVYEIGRIFRNEGISTKHNPEFTMLECYQAYADYNDVMKMVEEMVSFIAQEVLNTVEVNFGENTITFSSPWRRITLREAIMERCGIDFEKYSDADSLRKAIRPRLAAEFHGESSPSGEWRNFNTMSQGKLIDKLASTFVEPNLVQPTFVLDYPVELSPLAKRKPGSERLVERFEAFAGGMEIANAFTELNDPLEQQERFQQQLREREAGEKELELPDEDFVQALEYGMPPTGGLGVGIDRLVMLMTNQQSIREVILFPQLKTKE